MFFIALTTLTVACNSSEEKQNKNSIDLVVEEQKDSVRINGNNNGFPISFIIDVPTDGPRALVDSVTAYVNKELYDACESCTPHFEEDKATFSEEEMFTKDAKNLLSLYLKKYRPVIEDGVSDIWDEYSFSLKMVAQTESFVTYCMECSYCAAHCGIEKDYVIFDKNDGHLVREIISDKNLTQFLKDFPEYMTNINNDVYGGGGLFDNHFSLIILAEFHDYFLLDIPYDKILPYLSPEAQELVKKSGKEAE